MNFMKLVLKEIKGSRWTLLVFIALTVIWHLYILSRTGSGGEYNSGVEFLPFFVLPLWILGSMYYMLHSEWSTNTIYLLLSLPVKGWQITGSKLIASIINFIILGITGLISLALFFGEKLWSEFSRIVGAEIPLKWLFYHLALLIISYMMVVIVLLVLVQFSFLASRLISRFRGVVMGLTVFVGLWLYARLGSFLTPVFEWVPDLSIRSWYTANNVVQMYSERINSAPIVVVLLLTVLTFILGSLILDRYADV